MSPGESRNGREGDSIPEGGILAALPRARPQRASARRAAARSGAGTGASTQTESKPPRTTTKKQPTTRATAATKRRVAKQPVAAEKPVTAKKPVKPASSRRRSVKATPKPVEAPVPKQGYEPEDELELGKTVSPPSGVELVESVADIVGEIASSSLAAGGRLLKDAFSLLRRP